MSGPAVGGGTRVNHFLHGFGLFLLSISVGLGLVPCLDALFYGKARPEAWENGFGMGFSMWLFGTIMRWYESSQKGAKRLRVPARAETAQPAQRRGLSRRELWLTWAGTCALVSLLGFAAHLRTGGFPSLWQLALMELLCPAGAVLGIYLTWLAETGNSMRTAPTLVGPTANTTLPQPVASSAVPADEIQTISVGQRIE